MRLPKVRSLSGRSIGMLTAIIIPQRQSTPPAKIPTIHEGVRSVGRIWMDTIFYPVTDRLINSADTSPVATSTIEVGGGIGHDLDEFFRKQSDAPCHHILQDLPHVLWKNPSPGPRPQNRADAA
ncbi:O-methyltransferase [Colletotrichum orchidophilum]|uniref:O-methyltransferase n=1 Tax=Colletotrichum orchidophilum TaxID=1209926 RepID=A0A1G4ATE0_9PEZI|nr:O-methyltransferase [Colletotrichum orchidophilum]OHE92375.1 O-methyltransferase [Colletotrichum orchidophilum]